MLSWEGKLHRREGGRTTGQLSEGAHPTVLITKSSAAVCEPIACLPVKAIDYLTGAFRRGRDLSRPEVFDAFLYIPSAAACQSTLVAAGSRACPPAIC